MALEMQHAVSCMLITLNICQSVQQIPPVRVTPTVLEVNNTCDQFNYESQRKTVRTRILDYPDCNCGTAQGWINIAHLNMEDKTQSCPKPLSLAISPIRGCERYNQAPWTCDSVIYPVNGCAYSHVCGRILAYQTGRASAFYNSLTQNLNSLELAYLDGISLTYGQNGSRQHIWSFVKADHYGGLTAEDTVKCSCSIANIE